MTQDKAPRRARMQRNRLQKSDLADDKAKATESANNNGGAGRVGCQPFSYRSLQPSQQNNEPDRTVQFWFHVYLYSDQVDRLMAPFLNSDKRFAADRRLQVIMNKCGVRISLGNLEMYKSLPRRVVIMQSASWAQIGRAILEMEDLLPDFMRYASYPILMDTGTAHFNCTNFRYTAGIVRLTQPLD